MEFNTKFYCPLMGRLLLTLSVLLVTIIFMGTSFAVATDHTDQFVASGDNADSVPYAQGNSIINDSHVYTTASASGNPFIGNLPTHKDASVTDICMSQTLFQTMFP